MNKKSIFYYFVQLGIIILLIAVRENLREEYEIIRSTDYRIDTFKLIPVNIITTCIGLVLGLTHFMKERKKTGPWRINYIQLIILGIPTMYLAFVNVIMMTYIQPITHFSYNTFVFFGSTGISIFQVILGYILITSFSKNGSTKSVA